MIGSRHFSLRPAAPKMAAGGVVCDAGGGCGGGVCPPPPGGGGGAVCPPTFPFLPCVKGELISIWQFVVGNSNFVVSFMNIHEGGRSLGGGQMATRSLFSK